MGDYEPEVGQEPLVYCPRCRAKTDSLKCKDLPILVFVVFGYAWNLEKVVACGHCTCRHIGKRLFQSLFFANLAFPVVGIPYVVLLLDSMSEGHDLHGDALREYLSIKEPPSPQPFQTKPTPARLLLVFGILLAVIGGLLLLTRLNSDANAKYDRVIQEVAAQLPGPGSIPAYELPAGLRSLSADGTVHAVRTADGRVMVLIKTEISGDDFSGIVRCDMSFVPDDMHAGESTDFLAVEGLGGLAIKKRLNDRTLAVHHDHRRGLRRLQEILSRQGPPIRVAPD